MLGQVQPKIFYGWWVVGIAFVTMGIAVSARTAFSLFLPPLVQEFAWDRGVVAGAFSFGFLCSAMISPWVGKVMDRHGPRHLIYAGVVLLVAGLFTAPHIKATWQLYLSLGLLAGGGANLMSFTVQSLYLPNWFRRRRALAISIAFSGVGVGAIVLLPWLQNVIATQGWRSACTALGLLVLLIVAPITFWVRKTPQELGLLPDGDLTDSATNLPLKKSLRVVDQAWASVDWTLRRALGTSRFWWVVLAYFTGLYAWYAVQVHQTKYLLEIGFTPMQAAWALGLVSVIGIPGQIAFGAISDRIGREWIWTVGCLGFTMAYAMLLLMQSNASATLLYAMIVAQGFLGYAMTSCMGPVVAEIFEGKHYGQIFGTVSIAVMAGSAVGPWFTGVLYDAAGHYGLGFWLGMACSLVSVVAIWIAGPRQIRAVR